MSPDADSETPEPTELKYVGPATAEVIAGASFGPEAIVEKTVSFSMLLDAGVNPGVAARIRREHSLPWSFETEDRRDLDRRSSQVRGLGDGERAWVSASAGDWTEEDQPAGVEETSGRTPTNVGSSADTGSSTNAGSSVDARSSADAGSSTDTAGRTDTSSGETASETGDSSTPTVESSGDWATADTGEETERRDRQQESGFTNEWPETARPDDDSSADEWSPEDVLTSDSGGDTDSEENDWPDLFGQESDTTSDSETDGSSAPSEASDASPGGGAHGPSASDETDHTATPGEADSTAAPAETGSTATPAETGSTATPAEADGSGDPVEAETAWRQRSAPVPVSALDEVDREIQRTLADAGITSVRSLATADPAAVADALDLDESEIAELRETARSFGG